MTGCIARLIVPPATSGCAPPGQPPSEPGAARVHQAAASTGPPSRSLRRPGCGSTRTGAARLADPMETLGIVPDKPLPCWGWGDIPDQYGRR